MMMMSLSRVKVRKNREVLFSQSGTRRRASPSRRAEKTEKEERDSFLMRKERDSILVVVLFFAFTAQLTM